MNNKRNSCSTQYKKFIRPRVCSYKPVVCFIFFFLFHLCNINGQISKKQKIPRQPYFKYTLQLDKQKDSVTFYLSEFVGQHPMPLIVYIQGSTNKSLFAINDKGQIFPQLGHIALTNAAMQKARVLIIEKPGVQYLQQDENNPTFDLQFSLDSWAKRIEQIIRIVVKAEMIDSTRILVAGMSEGGVVAAKVAKDMGNLVTHTAILAGEGPSQLYSLYRLAEKQIYFNYPNSTPRQGVDSLRKVWQEVLNDPASVTKKFWGFTYLRWSSFLRTSVIEELHYYKGKILILQGDADENVFPESAKVLYTSLLAKGSKVELEIIDDADHSFNISTKPDVNGWEMVIKKSINWFLK